MTGIPADLDFFSGYNKDELAVLAGFFTVKKYSADDPVIRAGENGKELYIVLSGKVISTLRLTGSIDRKHIEYIRGDIFGELSVFGNKPVFDSYIASENSEILVIDENGFLKLIETAPGSSISFISKLLSFTITRFRKSSKFLSDVVEWGEKASRRVITDELTGLYNRAFLDDAIENFFYISQSNNKHLSFLMIDTDNFRKINEKIGLESGNSVIVEFADIVKRIISKKGIMARYGGDEFSILLPETDLKSALDIAENIRQSIESFDFSGHTGSHDLTITTSIGVSSFPETAEDLPSFRKKADESLYRAKEAGRNRVEYIR